MYINIGDIWGNITTKTCNNLLSLIPILGSCSPSSLYFDIIFRMFAIDQTDEKILPNENNEYVVPIKSVGKLLIP